MSGDHSDWPVGGGEMGALMRATDWSKTRLGPAHAWPRSLRTMLGVVLGSRFPMLLWWGPDLLHLYNDAYRPILRDKHPASLAAPAAETWAEIWDVAGPLAYGVMQGGPATWIEDLQLFIQSGNMAEETYFTFSYSPVPGDDGRVGGLLNTVQETTAKVQADRQIRTVHDMSARLAEARSEDDAHRLVVETLSQNELDLPFVRLYALDEGAPDARLVAAAGWDDDRAKPPRISLSGDAGGTWPLAEAFDSGRKVLVDDLARRFGPPPLGPWNGRPERALVLPLVRPGQSLPNAFLVAGVSPHRALDERYRSFYRAAADQVMTVIGNARAYEMEAKRAESLAEIDRAKTAFFSNISHEFRTPLTLMLGPTEDALASPEQTLSGEALRRVHRSTLRMMKLVTALLDFSRMESGRMNAAYEPTDLATLTNDLAGVFRSAVERVGLRFDVDCSPLPEPIYVDHDMWEKIVLNLLSNALKFTFDGEIGVALHWRDDRAELEVCDTGAGIPENELPHVFERFHRVLGTRSRTHEGSGIGLALAHDLVQLHGGAVRVASELGAGTTFTVSIPKGSAHLPPEHVVSARSDIPSARGALPFVQEAQRWSGGSTHASSVTVDSSSAFDARVLVVDDNADLRDYMVSLLAPHYEVETADDGLAALEAARRRPPTLILSDVMMPRLDGFGLLRALRDDPSLRSIPLVLLSARAGEEATVEGLEAGADDYLSKPFAARELIARVRTHVELARQRNAVARAKDAADLANRELEAFSYSVAHDLRAPLRSIDGFSQALLEDYTDKLDETGQKYLSTVRASAQRMAQLIDDLLSLSRVTRSELRRQVVDLSMLAESVVARLRSAEPARLVAVTIAPGLRGEGDARLLGVALDNLVGNAWKFTGKRELGHIEVGALPATDGDGQTYYVRDDGAGFDMAYADKLFGVFQRLHGTDEFEGTGIGLATVQRIIRRHKGRLWAEGAVDRGASFFFTLHDSEQ